MRDRLVRRNLRFTFDSFGRDLKGPRENQRDRKAEDEQRHEYFPSDPDVGYRNLAFAQFMQKRTPLWVLL